MIFPKLKDRTFGYVNLNIEAELWMKNKNPAPSKDALLDAAVSSGMVDDVHKKYAIDFSYGGWMEDRSFLWKGTYLEPLGTYIHLGIDVNTHAVCFAHLEFGLVFFVIKVKNFLNENEIIFDPKRRLKCVV